MGIGTSKGAFYRDEGHYAASMWDNRYDNNVIDPDILNPQDDTSRDANVIPPSVKTEDFITEVGKKDMPFPDNKNPDTDFTNRFGNLPPSGVLNDLKKPTGETVPLVRKIANITNTPAEIMDGVEGARSYPSGFSQPERVKSAALMHQGEIYEDMNHGLALGRIMDKFPDVNMRNIKDGFTTNRGRFVSREEAFDIAKSRNQIQDKVLPALTEDSKMLLSEDLK